MLAMPASSPESDMMPKVTATVRRGERAVRIRG